MKKATIARFVIGLAAISAVGCSAETGAPEAEGVGTTEQAIAKTGLGAGFESQFSSYIKRSNTEVAVFGGYDHTGAAVTTIKKGTFTAPSTFAFANYTNNIVLGAARAEAGFAPIPTVANKYAIFGGRSAVGAGNELSSIEIIDLGASPAVTAAGVSLGSARANVIAVPCGTGSKLLLIGGDDSGGGTGNALEVFDYNSGSPTLSTLKNKDNGTTVVTLSFPRFLGGAYQSGNKIAVFGGEDGSGSLLKTEVINVTNSCQFDDLDSTAGHVFSHPTTGQDMPFKLTEFAFAPISQTITSKTYDVIALGGTDLVNAANTTSIAYDIDTDTWTNSASLPQVSGAHVRPMTALSGTVGVYAVVGGLGTFFGDVATHNDLSTTRFDGFNGVTVTSTPAMTTARWGGWASDFNGTYLAGLGVQRTYVNPNYTNTWLTTNE